MDKLVSLLGQYKGTVITVGNAILILVAAVFIAYELIKAITCIRQKKMSEVAKHVMYAVLVAFIAAIGVVGIVWLMNQVAPDSGNLVNITNQWTN